MPRRSGDRERWRPDCGPDGAAPPGAEIGTSARLPVRIPLFQPRVESDDYLVETVHDEELDTASCVDLESTTGARCKHVAHARSIGYGRRRDFATKNRQILPSEHPVEAVGHKAEMGSRQEQPPTDCSPALSAIRVDRRKDRFLGLQVRFRYPNAQGKSMAPRGLARG